jgi:hypothetical protein
MEVRSKGERYGRYFDKKHFVGDKKPFYASQKAILQSTKSHNAKSRKP